MSTTIELYSEWSIAFDADSSPDDQQQIYFMDLDPALLSETGLPSLLDASFVDEFEEEEAPPSASKPHHATSGTGNQVKPKRKKKANRACFHCQKAHLTCEDCERRLFPSAARW
jgi:hypothetical protein